jgi:hypothetical protein
MSWMETVPRHGLNPVDSLAQRHGVTRGLILFLDPVQRVAKRFELGGRQPRLPAGRSPTLQTLYTLGLPVVEPDMGRLARHPEPTRDVTGGQSHAEKSGCRQTTAFQQRVVALGWHTAPSHGTPSRILAP